MKYIGENAIKKLISLIKGDLATKQPTITASGILKGDGTGTVTAADTQEATLVDVPNGLLKGDGTTISAAVAGTDYQAPLEDWDKAVLLKNVAIALPVSTNWRSVCYGDGKFVTMASNSDTGAYSTDGINWTQTTLPAKKYWRSVCYGNGKFVAVTSNNSDVAAYSTDGINWTQTTLSASAYWNSVCYGDGKFMAVGQGTGAAYSTDGINWTQATLPTDNWRSVCYGGGKFVAVAENTTDAAYSTDGINWTQTTLPADMTWYSVCYGGGKFVAVAYHSATGAYSTDGINWTQATLSTTTNWESICYGDGKFVAVAEDTTDAAYSTDGINWTQTTLPFRAYWWSVCYGNGEFVAVAQNRNVAAYSTDGITWTNIVYKVSNPAGTDVTTNLNEALGAQMASNTTPSVSGTASAGTEETYARGDHVHPHDNTKLSLTGGTMTGELDLSGSTDREITKLFWNNGIFNLSTGLGDNPQFKFNTDPSGGETTLSSGRVFSETGSYYGGSITLNQSGVIISGKGGDVEITNVKNPTADTDAANKTYVDSSIQSAIQATWEASY